MHMQAAMVSILVVGVHYTWVDGPKYTLIILAPPVTRLGMLARGELEDLVCFTVAIANHRHCIV